MTHEPECQKADSGCGQYPCVEVCICDEIRAAYQRGREDAARDVYLKLVGQFDGLDELLTAAARGDGEQA